MKLESVIPDKKLDTTDLSCPMPILKTKKSPYRDPAWATKFR
jgi:hypothetical protein